MLFRSCARVMKYIHRWWVISRAAEGSCHWLRRLDVFRASSCHWLRRLDVFRASTCHWLRRLDLSSRHLPLEVPLLEKPLSHFQSSGWLLPLVAPLGQYPARNDGNCSGVKILSQRLHPIKLFPLLTSLLLTECVFFFFDSSPLPSSGQASSWSLSRICSGPIGGRTVGSGPWRTGWQSSC